MLASKTAIRIPAALMALALVAGCTTSRAAPQAQAPIVDTKPAVRALDSLLRAWYDEIDELTATARALAVADDTYEFVARPNIPYVDAHYARDHLAAQRISTILIVNRKGEPLFWRRVNLGATRGFADAKAFLAELPELAPPPADGAPSFAGAANLAQGPSLVVAVPINAQSGSGGSRGWLIVVRALDAAQWHRYQERARVAAEVLDPAAVAPTTDLGAAMREPLVPIIRVDGISIHGLLALPDVAGKPFRAFSVSLTVPPIATKPPASAASGRQWPWIALAALVAGLAAVTVVGQRRRLAARTDSPIKAAKAPRSAAQSGASPAVEPAPLDSKGMAANGAAADGVAPSELPVSEAAPSEAVPSGAAPTGGAAICAAPTGAAANGAAPGEVAPSGATTHGAAANGAAANGAGANGAVTERAPRKKRVPEFNPVFLYQPQIDLQTGRVAGVEALLGNADPDERRPIAEILADIEAAGGGFALAQRWIQDACRNQRMWQQHVGLELPVGVAVSRRTLEDPGFPPFLRRVLAKCAMAPRFLELQVPEAVFGGGPSALRALANAHGTGVRLAIDCFNGARSSLRLLTAVPIAKLRVDPALVRNIGAATRDAVLFDGIVGAAGGLRIAVCATGVDTPDLVAATLRHGRPLAQGEALGSAVSAEQLLVFLRGSAVDTSHLPPLQVEDILAEPLGTVDGS